MGKVIDLGSGGWPKRDGIINVDIRPLPNVDVVADARALPFKDGEVDKIIARELIEHFTRAEIVPLLKEWRRVLRPEGELIIQTVDAEAALDNWRKMPPGRIWGALHGAQKNPDDLHKSLFTEESLKEYLNVAGFKNHKFHHLTIRDIPRLRCTSTA